jgi:hypothetical protein
MKRTHLHVETLWCGNARKDKGNGWSFPAAVRKRIENDTSGKSVLHLFGGRSTFGTRMDCDPIVRPDVIGDAWLPPFAKESFDVVVLDPPYIHINCQMKTSLFRAAGYIARERVIWFSTIWMAGSGGLFPERAYLVRVGDSCYVRCLQYFEVRDRRGPTKYFTRGPQMKYNRWLAGCMPLNFDAPAPEVAK